MIVRGLSAQFFRRRELAEDAHEFFVGGVVFRQRELFLDVQTHVLHGHFRLRAVFLLDTIADLVRVLVSSRLVCLHIATRLLLELLLEPPLLVLRQDALVACHIHTLTQQQQQTISLPLSWKLFTSQLSAFSSYQVHSATKRAQTYLHRS